MQFDLNALLQDPQFQTGMGMMGLASPKNRAMFQAYQMLQAQRQTQMEAEKQKQEMEYRQSQIGQSDARTKAYLRDIAVKEVEQKATERRWNLLLQSNPELRELVQQQEAGVQTPVIPTPAATTPQPSVNPLASAMQADPARPVITPEMQRGADLEAITMIQSELDKENNPLNKVALSREIERLQKGLGTAVPQAAPSGNKILQSEIDKYRKKKMLAGLMQSDPAKAAEIMAEANAPKTYQPGAMVSTTEGVTQIPDPAREADVNFRERKFAWEQKKAADDAARKSDTIVLKDEEKTRGKQTVDNLVSTLRSSFDELSKGGGIVDPSKGTLDNIQAGVASSGVGQFAGRMAGTKNQSARNNIAMARPLLLQAIMQATGMSAKQMDSNVELQMYLSAATDPSLDIQANKFALDRLQTLFGSPKTVGKSTGSFEDAEKERRYQEWKAKQK